MRLVLVALLLLGVNLMGCQTIPQISEPPYTKITIPSEEGTLIPAHLFRPEGPGPFPAVVALHGCAGLYGKNGTKNPRDLEWGQRLAENGYVAIYPDSFTPRGMTEICDKKDAHDIPRKLRPRDAYAALSWLQKQKFVKGNSVALMGWSNGGSSLLWTIDQHSALAPGEKEKDFKIAIAFYPGCRASEEEPTWATRLPLEILMGALDNWTVPYYCKSLADRAQKEPRVNLTLYPDSYHDFDAPGVPLHHLPYRVGKNKTAILGTNEKARAEAVKKVLEILSTSLDPVRP